MNVSVEEIFSHPLSSIGESKLRLISQTFHGHNDVLSMFDILESQLECSSKVLLGANRRCVIE